MIIYILEFTLLAMVWHILGAVILSFISSSALSEADGMEFVNPVFIHRHTRVNWFGAIVLMFFYTILCPFGAIGYWFYKLCVIGREDFED